MVPRLLLPPALLVPFFLSSAAAAQTVVYSPTGTQPDLQTAVDALNGPGVVVVPPGQWEHLGSLDVAHDDVTIIGAGSEHVTLARKPPPSSAGDAVRDLYTAPFVKTSTSLRSATT